VSVVSWSVALLNRQGLPLLICYVVSSYLWVHVEKCLDSDPLSLHDKD